jgi:hypothetical protein
VKLDGGELILVWTEKEFEKGLQPAIEQIYRNHFSELDSVERFDRTEKEIHPLDQYFAIDSILHFKNGSILTCQEKSRKNYALLYNDFTFEYYNDPTIGDKGEWFHLSSQIYFYGFANKQNTDYDKYYLIDMTKFRIWLSQFNPISKRFKIRKNPHPAKANFIPIPFKDIPVDCILYSKGENLQYIPNEIDLDNHEFSGQKPQLKKK